MAQGRLVIFDDDKANLLTMKKALEKVDYEIIAFNDPEEGLKFLQTTDTIDLVLSDLKMPKVTGIEILKSVKQKDPSVGVILITAFGSVESAVEAMKLGADDYIGKPIDIYELRKRVSAFVEKRKLSKEVNLLKSRLDKRFGFENIIAHSPNMKELLERVRIVANTRATVLIVGESGTGKELIANAIHQNSDRKGKPFLPINCAAIPSNLVESELFGYEKGAFTGAEKTHPGRFEQADGGTLFLDEIAELPLELQAKLLRVLEEKVVYRVGGTKGIAVDVRIVAATHRDLQEKVKEQKFREDLYFRLKVVELKIPPLRERKSDIPFLFNHFLNEFCKEHKKEISSVSKELLDFCENYTWQGNVRELKNLVERMVIFSSKDTLSLDDLPPEMRKEIPIVNQEDSNNSKKLPYLDLSLLEKEAILKALEETDGNKTQAAKLLGIGLRTLHRKLNEYNIVERSE
ncbi:MAG: sigma-54-dependent Fis family transcriptional regulator [Thermoanaerobaculaceae bacterium]|nr:sigma-54-dependent Fis family transcriptional regulator [Thermoanaerobaculaceae bacterium]